jgi:hypothetical protein
MQSLIEVKIVGVDYHVYYHGKLITKQRNLVKAVYKLYKYVKGQEWQSNNIRVRLYEN